MAPEEGGQGVAEQEAAEMVAVAKAAAEWAVVEREAVAEVAVEWAAVEWAVVEREAVAEVVAVMAEAVMVAVELAVVATGEEVWVVAMEAALADPVAGEHRGSNCCNCNLHLGVRCRTERIHRNRGMVGRQGKSMSGR